MNNGINWKCAPLWSEEMEHFYHGFYTVYAFGNAWSHISDYSGNSICSTF